MLLSNHKRQACAYRRPIRPPPRRIVVARHPQGQAFADVQASPEPTLCNAFLEVQSKTVEHLVDTASKLKAVLEDVLENLGVEPNDNERTMIERDLSVLAVPADASVEAGCEYEALMMAKDKVDAAFSDVVQLSYAIQHRLQSDPDIAGDYSLDLGTLWCNPDDHPFIPDIPAFLEARRAEWQPPDEQLLHPSLMCRIIRDGGFNSPLFRLSKELSKEAMTGYTSLTCNTLYGFSASSAALLEAATNLRSLTILAGGEGISQRALNCITALRGLESLVLQDAQDLNLCLNLSGLTGLSSLIVPGDVIVGLGELPEGVREMQVYGSQVPDPELLFSTLTKLDISCFNPAITPLNGLPMLSSLGLQGEVSSLQGLSGWGVEASQLRHLKMGFLSGECEQVEEILKTYTAVESIDLSCRDGSGPLWAVGGFPRLLAGLAGLQQLRSLTMDPMLLGELGNCFSILQPLESLTFQCCPLGMLPGRGTEFHALTNLTSLTIDLDGRDGGGMSSCDVGKMPKLRCFNLHLTYPLVPASIGGRVAALLQRGRDAGLDVGIELRVSGEYSHEQIGAVVMCAAEATTMTLIFRNASTAQYVMRVAPVMPCVVDLRLEGCVSSYLPRQFGEQCVVKCPSLRALKVEGLRGLSAAAAEHLTALSSLTRFIGYIGSRRMVMKGWGVPARLKHYLSRRIDVIDLIGD